MIPFAGDLFIAEKASLKNILEFIIYNAKRTSHVMLTVANLMQLEIPKDFVEFAFFDSSTHSVDKELADDLKALDFYDFYSC